MSYILDALRKSEQERQRESAPVLRSVHSEFQRGRRGPNGTWRTLALILLVVGATGAGLWFGYRSAPGSVDASAAPAPGAIPENAARESAAPEAQAPAEVVAPATPEPAAPQPALPPAADSELFEVWQLGEAEQRYLMDLQVTLHVYSDDPARRTVIINGFRVGEGQPLGQDLRLLEITRDGIIVDFRARRVRLATVEGL